MFKRALAAMIALTPAFVATPASAYYEYSGMNPTEGMSSMETLMIFGAIPVTVIGLVWFLWSLPKWIRDSKK